MVNIVFFEIQNWEKDLVSSAFPQALQTNEKLTSPTAGNFKDAEIISTFIYSKVDREAIDALPNLKLIVTRSTGFDHIDIGYAKSKNILVSNVPEYGSNTVAEHTFALILSLTRKIYQAINQTRNLNFNHQELIGTDLSGKTLGIIGLGKIGEHVLRIGLGFEMNVLAYSHKKDEKLLANYSFGYVDLDTLIKQSDIITLHLPLTQETKHIINTANILNFKKGSYLINTARGGLVQTEAILLGIDKGILDGVGLDVLEEEAELTEEASMLTNTNQEDLKTLVLNHVLLNHPKVLITPHNAFNSREALARITSTSIENIQSFIKGEPKSLV